MHSPVRDLHDLQKEAQDFVRTLKPGRKATLVTLTGELGAGKTTFVQHIAKALGVAETVTSPTFVLQKNYTLSNQLFTHLVHIDAYRLEKGEHLLALRFDELMEDAATLIMLEWPERVSDVLPPPTVRITFVVNDDGTRDISYD